MYSLTIFKNLYDNKTHRRMDFKTWSDFESLLYNLSEQPKESKKQAQLISPAVYQPDTTRANKNVTEWGSWAAVDVDDFVPEGDLKDDLFSRFGQWHYNCYSTASSTTDQPKFRLVFPLTGPVPAERIRHFWFALNTELESMGDRQTKDLSRMYYIPAKYAGAFNFIFSNTGDFVDADALMAKHEYAEANNAKNFLDRLPPELQQKVVEHRKSKLSNSSITWTSYRDCPFFPRSLAAEYHTISNTGWYHTMYRIMVAIALKAISRGYPITADQISDLCREFDRDTGNWYEDRPFELEANSALNYAYRNAEI